MPSSIDLAARLSSIIALQQEILGAVQDSAALTSLIVTHAPEICGGTGAVIELVEGVDLVYRAASGPAARHVGFRLPIAESLSGIAVRENQLIRCDDVELDPRVDIGACRDIGIRSMIVAPLTQKGGALGVLKLFAPHANAFDDLDSYSVQLVAGLTAAALQQARTFQDKQSSEERYRMLFERNVAGVFRTALDGKILDCNDALVGFLGYDSRNDLLQHTVWDLYRTDSDRERFLASLKDGHGLINIRIQLLRKDGSEINALVNASLIPVFQGESQVLGTLVEE